MNSSSPPPWIVSLFVNVAESPVKQCELSIHQYPDALVALRNQTSPPFVQKWTILLRVGPFAEYIEAEKYSNMWLSCTRGISRRIAKGFYLLDIWPRPLSLLVTPSTLAERRDIIQCMCSNITMCPPRPLLEILDEYIRKKTTQLPSSVIAGGLDTLPVSFRKTASPADVVRLYDLFDHEGPPAYKAPLLKISPELLTCFYMYWFVVGFNSTLFTRGNPGTLFVAFFVLQSTFDTWTMMAGVVSGWLFILALDTPRLIDTDLFPGTQSLLDTLLLRQEQPSSTYAKHFLPWMPIRAVAPEIFVFTLLLFMYVLEVQWILYIPFGVILIAGIACWYYYHGDASNSLQGGSSDIVGFRRVFRLQHNAVQVILPMETVAIQQNVKYFLLWLILTLPPYHQGLSWLFLFFGVMAWCWIITGHWTAQAGCIRYFLRVHEGSLANPLIDRILNLSTALVVGSIITGNTVFGFFIDSLFSTYPFWRVCASVMGTLILTLGLKLICFFFVTYQHHVTMSF